MITKLFENDFRYSQHENGFLLLLIKGLAKKRILIIHHEEENKNGFLFHIEYNAAMLEVFVDYDGVAIKNQKTRKVGGFSTKGNSRVHELQMKFLSELNKLSR